MSAFKTILAASVGAAVALASTVLVTALLDGASGTPDRPAQYVDTYTGDPDTEAALVAAEDRRVVEVRAIANAAAWTGASKSRPFQLETGNLYTLVLTEREAPYTIDDLLRMAPRSFVRQPDGAYALSENIVVEAGATLSLSKPGLDLRLQSTAESFTSIVTLGGSLEVLGGPDNPAVVSSWDPVDKAVDSDTSNGRAYIHVIGGHAEFVDAAFTSLGFWSGTTGGVALTGTELAVEPESETGVASVESAGTVGVGTEADGTQAEGSEVYGTELLPTEDEPTPVEADVIEIGPDLSGYSYVTARVENVSFTGNAFGLFITSADGVTVSNSTIKDSLVDGLVLHRDVKNTVIKDTKVLASARDGFSVRRASTGVIFDRVTATKNGRNGISLDGSALALGPNASGTSTAVYGNNVVQNSTSSDNGGYGIKVIGGLEISLTGNTLEDNLIGIAVTDGASEVVLRDNLISGTGLQGIAIRNSGTDAVVSDNTVLGFATGIYARDAGGSFERNNIEGATEHAVTLVGDTGASMVHDNTVEGSGLSAIDVARTEGAQVSQNDSEQWNSTKPLDAVLRQIFQPLTVLWLSLGLLVLFTAVSGVGRRRGEIVNPYASQAPLHTLTRGIVAPDDIGRGASA